MTAPMSGPKAFMGKLTLYATSPARVVGGLLDIDLERRPARGVASWSLKGRRSRDLGSLGGGRGGELGGSESELDEAIAKVFPSARGEEKACGSRICERSKLKAVSYTRVSWNGGVCVIFYLLSRCRSNGGGISIYPFPWQQTGLAGKNKRKKTTPRRKKISHQKEKRNNKGKTKEIHSREGPAPPPLRPHPPLCPLGAPSPLLCNRPSWFSGTPAPPPLPLRPQESDRQRARPLPTARLRHVLPQPPLLFGPRPAPGEEVMPGLWLAACALPALVRVRPAEPPAVGARRCVPRKELIVSSSEGLPGSTKRWSF